MKFTLINLEKTEMPFYKGLRGGKDYEKDTRIKKLT